MIPNKGRYLDCNEISQPQGTWRAGKNFVVNGKKAAFVNEPGTDLTATEFPFDIAKPIGAVVFPNGSYVVMADGGVDNKDRLGVVDTNGVYTDLIVDNALNFSSSFPIRSSEIDYNNFIERIIGFTDKYNPFRVINIDNLPFPLNPDLSLVDPTNITDIEAFPKLMIPQVEFTINQVGGSLPAGAYSVCVAYEGNDGTRTPNSPPIKTILIADDPTSVGYDKFDGIAPGTMTPKSITFYFSNVDTRYDKLVLIIVRKVDNQTETIAVKKVDVSGATATVTYLGSETTQDLPIEEVLTTRPLYKTVGCCTQLNSQLYLGNLTADEDIEYQVYANNVKIFYNTKLALIQDINESQKHELAGGFAHGGVYAFYIAFVLKNGSWSRAFHIPGRTGLPGGTHDVITVLAKPVNIVSPYEPAVFPAPGGWDPGLFSQANFDNSSGFITTSIQFNDSVIYGTGVKIVVAVTASYAIFQHTFSGNEVTSVNETITTTVTTSGDVGASTLAVAAGLPPDTKTYQIEDTTNKPTASYILDGDTNVISTMGGLTNMGYWENQNESYPANFVGLAGQKIRHHVFPSIRKCKEVHYSGVPGYGRDQFDVLGIDVSNVVIPPEFEDKIEGWGIFYAKREYQNSNTLGNDLFLVAHKTLMDGNIIWSAGGNWRQKAFTGEGPWGGDSEFIPHHDFLRGHNFELLKDKPALSASSLYLDFELKLRKENLCDDFMVVGKSGGNIAKSGGNFGQNAGAVIDETDNQHVIVSLPPTPLLRALYDFKYLPSNVIYDNIRTLKNEEIIHIRVHDGDGIPWAQSETQVYSIGKEGGIEFVQSSVPNNGSEETYLMTYKQIKTDVFAEFNNQILTLTDQIALPTATSMRKIRGGDTWATVRSFLCISPRHAQDFEQINGTTVIRAHIAESRYNVGMRHELIGDVTTKYYPKTPAPNFWDNPSNPDDSNDNAMIFDRTTNPNGLAYSIDFNSTNTYSQLVTYHPSQRLTNRFPFRVIRGGATSGARSDINGWKTFLAADYYESNRNRGEITDLFVLDDNLFIHHYYGLFRTLGTERLSLGTTEVYLGSGDIFSQRPKEPISTELGFLGCQDIFTGVTFKGQRFWVDQSQGRVFLLSKQGVNELSDNGMFQFFRDNLKINNPPYPENPIDGEGLLATYDSKFDRIILVKKTNENAFTLSYSTDKEQGFWCFNHDYTPDYLFYATNNFYGFKNNKIHKFNSPTNKAKYFEGNPQNSEIELIFNQSSEQHKEFFNINWISEVIDQAGILLKNKTLTAVRVRTSYQDSGEVTLVPFTTYGAKHNIRRFKNTWNFNRFKDVNADPYKKKAMMDNWCSITFIFNNTPNLDASQNSLYLYLLNAKALLAPEL